MSMSCIMDILVAFSVPGNAYYQSCVGFLRQKLCNLWRFWASPLNMRAIRARMCLEGSPISFGVVIGLSQLKKLTCAESF